MTVVPVFALIFVMGTACGPAAPIGGDAHNQEDPSEPPSHGRASGGTAPSRIAVIQHSTGTLRFRRVQVPGDGNCALHAIEKTRSEFVRLMDQQITDRRLQEMIMEDMQDARIPVPRGQQGYEIPQYRHYIRNMLSSRNEHLSFPIQPSLLQVSVPDVTTPSPDNEVTGTLSAAAYVFNLNVRVWRGSFPTIRLSAKMINDPSNPNFYDLIMTREPARNRSGHYDRLVIVEN